MSENKDVELSFTDVQQSKFDIIAVKFGERPSGTMALFHLENNKFKWISGDHVVFIIEDGRILRTQGLPTNLLYMSNVDLDPIKSLPLNLNYKNKLELWSRAADFTGDEYGHMIESTFQQDSKETLKLLDIDIETTLYVESLNYLVSTDYIRGNSHWKNYFWYTEDGTLIKSIQKLSPMAEPIEIIYLSRVVRLNS